MGNIQFYLSDARTVLQFTVQNVLKEVLTELNPSRVAVALVLKKVHIAISLSLAENTSVSNISYVL